jgi:hypothetical protein
VRAAAGAHNMITSEGCHILKWPLPEIAFAVDSGPGGRPIHTYRYGAKVLPVKGRRASQPSQCAHYRAGPDASTRIETFEADVTLPSTLPAAVAGAEYVLCAAGGKGFFSAEAVDNLVSMWLAASMVL